MKTNLSIISLNTWGGRVGNKLIEFFNNNQDVDIFCLQEIFNEGKDDPLEVSSQPNNKDYNLLFKIQAALPNHVAYFRPSIKEYYGLAIFVKKGITVLEEGEEFVYRHKGYIPEGNLGFHARNIQHIKTILNGKELFVINFHGLWNGQGKTDTEDRIKQSENIISYIEKLPHDVILCGDFNLYPDTESIKRIEQKGLRNLIKENNIQSTRTSFYTNPDKFADYVFVTKTINVDSFEIMKEEVSDHCAMRLMIIL